MKGNRFFIPNVITPKEAIFLKENGIKDSKEIIDKIKKVIEEKISPDIAIWDEPSKIRIERSPNGHPWHVDTGSSNHMLWCAYGASILLTDDDRAGYLEYRDGTKILPKEHYCSMTLHSSDVEHRVEQNSSRVTLLSFLQRKL